VRTAYRGAAVLTRTNPHVSALLATRSLKLIAFVEASDVLHVNSFLPQLATHHTRPMPLLVDAAHSYTFLRRFGLSRADLPTAVVCRRADEWNTTDLLLPRTAPSAASLRALLDRYAEQEAMRVVAGEDGGGGEGSGSARGGGADGAGDASGGVSIVSAHSVVSWRQNVIRDAHGRTDFERLCTSRALIRSTMTTPAAPTGCLILVSPAPSTSVAWPVLAQVIDSPRFLPSRRAYELMTLTRGSKAEAELREALGGALEQAGLPQDVVVAVEPASNGAVGRPAQVRVFPSSDGVRSPIGWLPPSQTWSAADGASIGAFGMFVVGLEAAEWHVGR